MNPSVRLYISSVLLSLLLATLLWVIMAWLKHWPLRMTVPFVLLFAELAIIGFACYLLIPLVNATEQKKLLLLYLPFIIAIATRGYYMYNVSNGKMVEMNFSFSNSGSSIHPWQGKIAECLVVLLVCVIAQRRYQRMTISGREK